MTDKGRKKRTQVDTFRARAWFNAVSGAFGDKSASELEERWYQEKIKYKKTRQRKKSGQDKPNKQKSKRLRTGMWHKYKRGDATPSKLPIPGSKTSLVQWVEGQYKGTQDWLHLPLWNMLDRHPITMDEIKIAYLSLSDEVQDIFIADKNTIFWRRPVSIQDILPKLKQLGGLDAATAMVTMIREAEITQNQEQYCRSFKAWVEIAPSMQTDGLSWDLIEDIWKYMAEWFKETECFDNHSGSKSTEISAEAKLPQLKYPESHELSYKNQLKKLLHTINHNFDEANRNYQSFWHFSTLFPYTMQRLEKALEKTDAETVRIVKGVITDLLDEIETEVDYLRGDMNEIFNEIIEEVNRIFDLDQDLE